MVFRCIRSVWKESVASGNSVIGLTQSRVDKLILDFIIEDMQSLSVVEQPAFIKLIKGLQPSKNVISRKTVTTHVENRYKEMQAKMTDEFSSLKYICTTVDIWSLNNRGFLGTTAHWIDQESLHRKSAALCFTRFKGRHTYDTIAAALEQVNVKYGIIGKVSITVTDNGSNFIKAFRIFGQPDDDNQQAEVPVDGDDVEFSDMQQLLEAKDEAEYCLPAHQACASHTLNLIATHDAATATADNSFKKVYYAAMGKCSAFWNKASRSVQAAEIIHDEFHTSLMVPNDTRWNSHYEAVEKIRSIAVTYNISTS